MATKKSRIPPLESGFKNLDTRVEPLKKWLQEAQDQELKQVEYPASLKDWLATIGIGTLVSIGSASLFYYLFSFIHSILEMRTSVAKVLFLACIFALLVTVSVLASWLATRQNKLRNQQLAKLHATPLCQRCQLILRAIECYKSHCKRYELWQEAANLDLLERDNELAVRYQNFILRTHENLELAINDFQRNADFARKQKEFFDKHPVPTELNDAPLGQLMAEINKPIEIPNTAHVFEPRVRLACEEELEQVFVDPLGEHELAAKIDALGKR